MVGEREIVCVRKPSEEIVMLITSTYMILITNQRRYHTFPTRTQVFNKFFPSKLLK